MRNGGTFGVGPLLLASVLAAAPQDSQASALQQAIVVEVHEHDLAEAAKRYRAIGEGGGAEAAEAWLRLGTLEQRLGRADQARKALDRALALDPVLAPRVAEVGRQDSRAVDPKLRDRVQEIVRKALASDSAQRQQLIENLRWLGNAVAPLLGEIVVTRKQELEEAKFAASALLSLAPDAGKPVLEQLFAHPDVMVRRLLLRAYAGQSAAVEPREFLRFLDDPDAELRAETVRRLGHLADVEKKFALADDADARVREAALNVLAMQKVADDADGDRFLQRLLAKAREKQPDLSSEALTSVVRRLVYEEAAATVGPQGSYVFQREPRRRLLLQVLTDPLTASLRSSWHLGNLKPEPALRDEAFAAANTLGPVPPTGPSPRQVMLIHYLEGTLEAWPASATEQVAALATLGYEGTTARVSQWLGSTSDPERADEVLGVLGRCRDPRSVLRGLNQRNVTISKWEVLRPLLEEDSQLRHHAVHLIGTADQPQARLFLLEQARSAPKEYVLFADALLRGGKAAAPQLVELLQIETPPPQPPQPGQVWVSDPNAQKRNQVFAQLAAWGSKEALAMLARAYVVGLQHHHVPGSQPQGPHGLVAGPRGLQVLKDDSVRGQFDDATLAAAVDACLATRRVDAFDDAASLLGPALPDAVFEVFVRHAESHPNPKARESFLKTVLHPQDRDGRPRWHPALRPLIERSLLADDADLRRAALGAARVFAQQLDAAGIRQRIDQLLASKWDKVTDAAQYLIDTKAPDAFAKLEPLARDEQSGVRHRIVGMLVALDRERAAPLALELLRSSNVQDRLQGIELQRALLDPKAVKPLLELMRDPHVRNKAAETLEAIDLYQRTWKRWATTLGDAAGVPDASTAAEALARQALDQKERKDVRLAALASLGTLAVPETLPLLVQLLKDPDGEVSSAARAAIDKVNSAPKK
jgi:HEAT repeat protein